MWLFLHQGYWGVSRPNMGGMVYPRNTVQRWALAAKWLTWSDSQAEDKDQVFCFTLKSFSSSLGRKDWAQKGKKTTRQDYLKFKKKALQNSSTMTNAIIGTNISSTEKKIYVFLETDFQ